MSSKREREWYRKFQEGTFLIRGWQSRKKEILEAIPATEIETVDELLDNLGEKSCFLPEHIVNRVVGKSGLGLATSVGSIRGRSNNGGNACENPGKKDRMCWWPRSVNWIQK